MNTSIKDEVHLCPISRCDWSVTIDNDIVSFLGGFIGALNYMEYYEAIEEALYEHLETHKYLVFSKNRKLYKTYKNHKMGKK